VLADALAGGKDLKPNDWRLLAFYSWDTDQTQVIGKDEVARRWPGSPPRAPPTSPRRRCGCA
jgi:hypothetical protein